MNWALEGAIAMALGLAMSLAAWHAAAEGLPRYVEQSGDEYQLTRESEDLAVVEYLNGAAQMSPGHDVHLTHDGVTVRVRTDLNVGAGGAERIVVEPEGDWWADPPSLDVVDGTRGVVILRRGEWLGM